jgi:hypothetical protein
VDYAKNIKVSIFTAAEGPTVFPFESRPAADYFGDLRGAIHDASGSLRTNCTKATARKQAFCDGTFSGRWVAEGAGQQKD